MCAKCILSVGDPYPTPSPPPSPSVYLPIDATHMIKWTASLLHVLDTVSKLTRDGGEDLKMGLGKQMFAIYNWHLSDKLLFHLIRFQGLLSPQQNYSWGSHWHRYLNLNVRETLSWGGRTSLIATERDREETDQWQHLRKVLVNSHALLTHTSRIAQPTFFNQTQAASFVIKPWCYEAKVETRSWTQGGGLLGGVL